MHFLLRNFVFSPLKLLIFLASKPSCKKTENYFQVCHKAKCLDYWLNMDERLVGTFSWSTCTTESTSGILAADFPFSTDFSKKILWLQLIRALSHCNTSLWLWARRLITFQFVFYLWRIMERCGQKPCFPKGIRYHINMKNRDNP